MTSENQSNSRIGFIKEAIPSLDWIYKFAFGITGKDKIAYKLLKVAFLKAFRFYDHLDQSIDFNKWMLRITKNTYLDSFNRRLDINNIEYEQIQIQFAKLKTEDLDSLKQVFFEKLTEREITDMLSSLPDDYKIPLVCNSFMNFSYEEIVDFIDLLPGLVRLKIHQARKILFVILYNYAVDKGYINKIDKENVDTGIKENRDYYYLAALADDELKNSPEALKIKDSMNKDPELLFEYKVQVFVKELIKNKVNDFAAPDRIRKKMERKFGLHS